ncbi:MAG: phosphatidylglycerol lysyltransferase domain-containing protein [Candidatus Cloacimonetes bacterium]|nr:phosphatidylglycerol lysyltransferase domain-containing protein [Candidatus Cloacimonadota bacterium]
MTDLITLGPEDAPLLKRWLDRWPRQNCDYSVVNLLTWGRIYGNQYVLWRGHLLLYNPKYAYVFFPVGPGLPSSQLRELLDGFREQDPEAELILVPENWRETNPDLEDYFTLKEERDWADYVYGTDKMVALSGKKLAKKKNLVSQFARTYPEYHVLPITPDKHEVILRFTEKWKRQRSAEGIYLNTEFQAIQHTLEMWDALPVEGIIICHRHKISAYSIFSPINPEMATIHFEKFDPEMKGSAQLINWETARRLQGRFAWINREQDMGLEGLRQAKLTYQPDFLPPFITAR